MTNKFYKNLEKEIYRKGLTQVQMAREVGVAPATIQKYITGECLPSMTKLIKIASALNVSIDRLVTGKEEQSLGVQKIPFNGNVKGEILINLNDYL